MATALSENGKYFCYFEQGYCKAFDLVTGTQLWSTKLDDYPWAEFSLYTTAGYSASCTMSVTLASGLLMKKQAKYFGTTLTQP